MGGSNQSIFLISALIAGQGNIPGQGSAAIPLLLIGLLLSFAAAPGWLELVLMFPNRVGGIAASCTAAFKPYSEILTVLTGVCYWWGWVPTCGLTALFSGAAIHQWLLPGIPISAIAIAIVLMFLAINLTGIRATTRVAVVIATASSLLAILSAVIPVASGTVDWHRAATYHLVTPFPGWFGQLTSLMAGLYLIGFGAPAFEAATCHVGETVDHERNLPRSMLANAAMAGLYFAVLPVIWLGFWGRPMRPGSDGSAVRWASGSSCSTCFTARSNRSPEPPVFSLSSPRMGWSRRFWRAGSSGPTFPGSRPR
jgi:amino acid transporter